MGFGADHPGITDSAEPLTDQLSTMKVLGWSGFGHFHQYTEDDPTGRASCAICSPEATDV